MCWASTSASIIHSPSFLTTDRTHRCGVGDSLPLPISKKRLRRVKEKVQSVPILYEQRRPWSLRGRNRLLTPVVFEENFPLEQLMHMMSCSAEECSVTVCWQARSGERSLQNFP